MAVIDKENSVLVFSDASIERLHKLVAEMLYEMSSVEQNLDEDNQSRAV
jgi:hypothetical protein